MLTTALLLFLLQAQAPAPAQPSTSSTQDPVVILDTTAGAEKLVAVAIELKFVEFDDPGRHSGRHFLGAKYTTRFPIGKK